MNDNVFVKWLDYTRVFNYRSPSSKYNSLRISTNCAVALAPVFPMFDLAKVLEIFIVNRFHQRNWPTKSPKSTSSASKRWIHNPSWPNIPVNHTHFTNLEKVTPKNIRGIPFLRHCQGGLSIKNWLQKMFQKKVAICKNPQLPKRVDLFFANCFHMFPSRLPDIRETVKDCNLYLGGGSWRCQIIELEINWDCLFWAFFQELSGSHKPEF